MYIPEIAVGIFIGFIAGVVTLALAAYVITKRKR